MNQYFMLLLSFILLTVAGCWDKSKPQLPRPTVSANLDISHIQPNEIADEDNVNSAHSALKDHSQAKP